MSIPPWPSKKTGNGILTGKNLLTGRQFLSLNSVAIRQGNGEGSKSPDFTQKSESEKAEDDSELMLYLSQVNSESKHTKKSIDWDIVDDLDEADALSDIYLEISPAKTDYFLKPKESVHKDPLQGDSSATDDWNSDKENRACTVEDPHHYTDSSHSKNSATPSKCFDELTSNKSEDTSEENSFSLRHHILKEHIFTLDELGTEVSQSPPKCNDDKISGENGFQKHSAEDSSVDISLSPPKYIDDKIGGEKGSQKHSSEYNSVYTSLIVDEDLETSESKTKLVEGNTEVVYSAEFEEDTELKELSSFSVSKTEDSVKPDKSLNSAEDDNSTITLNVISKLPSFDDSEKSGSLTVTSVEYTMDFSTSDAKSESTLNHHQSSSPKPSLSGVANQRTRQEPVTDTGTQTLIGADNMLNFPSWVTPTVSLGPPKFSTDYRDPPPVVLPADTLEVLTAYSPNMMALNDMLRSQLSLTRQLLDSNRALLNSLTSSLSPDYQYTTLEGTRQYIHQHRPKVLTLAEARNRTKHK